MRPHDVTFASIAARYSTSGGPPPFVGSLAMTYEVRVLCDEADFAALEDRWGRLMQTAADANTFLSHQWLYAWWCAYRPRAKLRIVVAERMGRLCGIAPMMLTREGRLERVIQRVRFIGDGTSETDHMNFIVDRSDREGILRALLDEVSKLPWQVAHFSQMPERSENTIQLLQRAELEGWFVDSRVVPCPRVLLPANPDDLLRSLPSRLRTAIRSARRDLNSSHKVEFGMTTEPDELGSALQILYRNHAGRWQAKGESGVFVDGRKRTFYETLSRKLLDAGMLRFFYLRVDGEVIAQQYCFEFGGTVYLLQEGFDIAWSAKNVGNVLRAMVLEFLIDRGSHVYDFLAGVTRHKRHWSNAIENDLHLRFFRGGAAGTLLRRLVQLRMRLKQRVPALQAGVD